MIKFKQRGNFNNLSRYLKRISTINIADLDSYGKEGVAALASATPVDSGKTANSWEYKITKESGRIKISFYNTNVQDGVPIAIILQYGHGTKNGGWVDGRDYINPAIRPVFDKITKAAWTEVTKT